MNFGGSNAWLAALDLGRGMDPAVAVRLCLTLVHFAWQGTAVALLVAVAWPVLRRASAVGRYRVLVAALLVMAACPVVTFALLKDPPAPAPQAAVLPPNAAQAAPVPSGGPSASPKKPTAYAPPHNYSVYSDSYAYAPAPTPPAAPPHGGAAANPAPPPTAAPASGFAAANLVCREHVRPYAPGATLLYLAGVALMLARLGMALFGNRRLGRSSLPADDPALLAALARQANRLGLGRPPRLAYCVRLLAPCVVGVVRPTILLPLSIASGLSPEQVEAVLAHELAHVRRYDHLVNLFQRLVEAFLFFHPAVWVISNRIRAEREHCCDDLAAAGAEEGRLAYADALVRVAELARAAARRRDLPDAYPVAALAATGRPSGLGVRVRRLVDRSFRDELRLGRGAAAGMVMLAVLAAAVAAWLPGRLGAQPTARPAAGTTPTPATVPGAGAPIMNPMEWPADVVPLDAPREAKLERLWSVPARLLAVDVREARAAVNALDGTESWIVVADVRKVYRGRFPEVELRFRWNRPAGDPTPAPAAGGRYVMILEGAQTSAEFTLPLDAAADRWLTDRSTRLPTTRPADDGWRRSKDGRFLARFAAEPAEQPPGRTFALALYVRNVTDRPAAVPGAWFAYLDYAFFEVTGPRGVVPWSGPWALFPPKPDAPIGPGQELRFAATATEGYAGLDVPGRYLIVCQSDQFDGPLAANVRRLKPGEAAGPATGPAATRPAALISGGPDAGTNQPND